MTSHFDPDAAAAPGSGLFGLRCGPEDARVHILGVPFDATTSYRKGAAHGPAAVAAASHQVDLHDRLFGRPFESGIWLDPDEGEVAAWNHDASEAAQPIIDAGGVEPGSPELARVDALGARLNDHVHAWTARTLAAGRIPAILGGDHAVPFGAMLAAAEAHPGLGILHFDAHADLRDAYEGFRWSHASILHNVLAHAPDIERLVQVGLRDLGAAEARRIAEDPRIVAVFDDEWARARFEGRSLLDLVRRSIALLPDNVWITFDVDGLDPKICPGTGTPVPGGLDWNEAMLWLSELAASKKRIVGFDLVEVSPGAEGTPAADSGGDGWDAIVGARLLYRLCGAALARR